MPRKGDDNIPLLNPADRSDTDDEDELFVNFTTSGHRRTIKRRCRCLSLCCKLLVTLVLILTLVGLILFSILLINNLQLFTSIISLVLSSFTSNRAIQLGDTVDTKSPAQGPDWTTILPGLASRSPTRAVHVNGDAVLDLIIGFAGEFRLTNGSMPSYCLEEHSGDKICRGGIIAFDGKDGSTLWKTPTRHSVFELKCPDVDADGDGVSDCFGSGRKGTLVALNPRNGDVIWTGPDVINPRWSVFAPAFIQDVDGDGVRDMVVANGGDSDYSAEEHNRTANELLILSTATGQMIGDRKLSTPDGRETYCLPVIYEQLDGSQYILFGSGGETVSGGLYMISLRDMLSHVSPGVDYNLTGGYSRWEWMDKNSQGVITLYQSKEKGFMLPPVLADLNLDGDDDIIALSHDGLLLALSGANMSHLWGPMNFTMGSSTETYTLPAVGLFNDDEHPDLMVTWQTGAWPTYFTQMTYVLDGSDGSILWYKRSPANAYTNMALLTLSTTQKNRDAFFFSLSSTSQTFSVSEHAAAVNQPHGDTLERRHAGVKHPMSSVGFSRINDSIIYSCDFTNVTTMDYFIMDRSTRQAPLLLHSEEASPYFYNVTPAMVLEELEARANSSHSDTSGHQTDESGHVEDYWKLSAQVSNETVVRCSMMRPDATATGIIADLDGDGVLELVLPLSSVAPKLVDGYSTKLSSDDHIQVSLVKYSLGPLLRSLPQIALETLDRVLANESISLPQLPLSAATSQRWRQLQGEGQNGVY